MASLFVGIVGYLKRLRATSRSKKVYNEFARKAVLVGGHHNFSPKALIRLSYSSTKGDIILHDHCEIFGAVASINGGKIILHDWVKLGYNSRIEAVNRIEIGKDTAIADGVTIIDNNSHPICPADRRYMRHTPHGSLERSAQHAANAPIIIGENVWIGANARICKGVTIGDNAIIAAHSVVTHNVPANAVAAGNPAKIVKENIDKTTTPIFPLK